MQFLYIDPLSFGEVGPKKITAFVFIILLIVSCGGGGTAAAGSSGSGSSGSGSGSAPTGNLKSQVDLVGTT